MSRKYRVIQWSTGHVGQLAIRTMLDHPELELAGVWVFSEAKDGRDAGELCGLEPLGITATRDVDELLALDADCVCYTPLEMNPAGVIDDVCRILASGKNVVTTAAMLGSPAVHGPATVERLNAACDAGGASLFGTGVTPDGAESVLADLMSMCRDIESISRTEIVDCGSYTEPYIFPGMGFGAPAGTPPPSELMQAFFAPVLSLLATFARIEIDEVRHSGDSAPATRSFDTPAFHIEKGTVAAVYHRLEGISDGRCRVVADGYYRMGGPDQYPADWPPFTEPSGYRLVVKGKPEIRADLYVGSSGADGMDAVIAAAAHRAVNAIPAVCEARSGIRTVLDLPHVTGRMRRLVTA
ncbi:MAG: NAD(P)H-dependent amine dehydrogenase family protein [Solirubrobacteraceae bacterium]